MMEPPKPECAGGGGAPVPLARLLAGEIAVGTAVNILFNMLFAWLAFYGRPIGQDAVLLDVLPATFVPALVMTFPVTFLMRRRIGRGLAVSPGARLPLALPRNLLRRSLAIALLALALVAVPVVVLLRLVGDGDWTWSGLVAFKLAFSALHAAIVTPIVVLAALTVDRHSTPSIADRRM